MLLETIETEREVQPVHVVDGATVIYAHSPYIGDNYRWYVFNDNTGEYEDSGVVAGFPANGGIPEVR